MNYRVRHITRYHYAHEFASCHNQLHLRPLDLPHQQCLEHVVKISPNPEVIDEHTDSFGNHVESFELHTPSDRLEVDSLAVVELKPQHTPPTLRAKPSWEQVRDALTDDTPAGEAPPLDVMPMMFASHYVRLSSRVHEFAREHFLPGLSVLESCTQLMRHIFQEFKFDPKATEVGTSVDDVLTKRRGVCQDFAHLMIACVRSMGLPARYVSGYLLTEPAPGMPRLIGADASHAWVSVWCDDLGQGDAGWIEFDPTNSLSPCDRHITVAYGRDFGDVSPVRGVVLGGGGHRVSVSVDVARVFPSDL